MKKHFLIQLVFLLYLSQITPARAIPTGLEATFKNGQTFLTWDLIDADSITYRIYKSTFQIQSGQDLLPDYLLWEVNNSSVVNQRKTIATDTLYTYCIEDTIPLDRSKGLYVHTAPLGGSYYYAVTSVQEGIEDTAIVLGEGGNSLDLPVSEEVMTPQPVLQYEGIAPVDILIRDYVHWGTNVDTDSVQAMASYPSFPYNFRVWNVPQDTSRNVLRFFLHSGEAFFTQRGRVNDGAVIISPDCPKQSYPLYDLKKTYWFGYNSNLGFEDPLTDGINVNYHERRILYLRDWAVRNLNIDPDAVFFTGGSYGACGSVLMAMAHPEEIASIIANLPKLDFSDTSFIDFDALVEMWGHPEDHIMTSDSLDTYQRLNAVWIIDNFGSLRDFPVMTMFFGRNDSTMGWLEKVEFMEKAQEMRIGGAYFWDSSAHGFGGLREWSLEFFNRVRNLYRYRVNQSYPAVSYLSINDDPGDGSPWSGDSVGTYGGYVDWVPETIVDEKELYEVSIGLVTTDSAIVLPADTATAEVTLRRLQNFEVYEDSLYYFVNIDTTTGEVVQRAFVKPDSTGLLTVEGVELSTDGHRLRYVPVSSYFHYDPVFRDSTPVLRSHLSFQKKKQDRSHPSPSNTSLPSHTTPSRR